LAKICVDINGKTKLLGILGSGIGYTFSPSIHNFSANHLGHNHVYVPFDLPHEQVARFIETFWDIGGIGFNVTTPHKELVAKLIPGHNLNSVNTVFRGHDGWRATSTDAEGLAAAVSHLGISFKGFSRFIVLGSGGVVTAILNYIARHFESVPEVFVLRRNAVRDQELRSGLPPAFNLTCLDFRADVFKNLIQGGAGETLVIQASSAPHHGDDLARFADAVKDFNGVLVDVVYGAESALLKAAEHRGIPFQDGLPMLIEQARVAQKHWWGNAAPYNEVYRFLTGKYPTAADD
jgi:shikimate dehydrogenase